MKKLLYKSFVLTKGVGQDSSLEILGFDKALSAAGIHQCNLVYVSSMLPVNAIEKKFKKNIFGIGEIVFCVMSRIDGKRGQSICAGLGYAQGYDINRPNVKYGFVIEGHDATQAKLKRKLNTGIETMAKLRHFRIIKRSILISHLKVKLQYGTAVVVLLYR